MNRRAFFGSLAALTVGMALDPERALWVPGRRTFFDIQRPRQVLYGVPFRVGDVFELDGLGVFAVTERVASNDAVYIEPVDLVPLGPAYGRTWMSQRFVDDFSLLRLP